MQSEWFLFWKLEMKGKKKIKEKFKNARLPVVLISGETDISAIAKRCGADGFISKPFDIEEVLKRITQLMK